MRKQTKQVCWEWVPLALAMPPWCSPDVDRTRLPRAGDGASCFLLLWLVTLPFTLISTFAWWSTPMVSIVAFLFFNLEQMAMEIEQPFGDDPNDLPLEEFCLRVERVLLDILRRALKPGSAGEEGGDKGRSGQPRQPDEALEARAVSSL